MHDAGEDDFVFLDKEPRRFEPDDESLRVTTSASPSPTLVPCPIPQTLTFQVVRFSGILSETSASPLSFVSSAPTHRAVSAKFDAHGGLHHCGLGQTPLDSRLR